MREAIHLRTRRVGRRFVLLLASGLATLAVVAGVAFARADAPSVGTGVVVINTNLGLQGGAAAGTGMVLTKSGEVLTNNHVIRGATSIRVVVPGTGRSYRARVVGYDVTDDVAVLKAVNASNLKTVSTSTATLKIGQRVTAVGNANGSGRLISARGTITGLRQSITVSDDQGGTESLTGLIRTNAALQPGDSGGPLKNSAGKVIGMDTAASTGFVFRSTASTGYAIPIGKALSIAKQVEAGRASARVHIGATAFLGIQVQGADVAGGGVLVEGVVSGGPAAAAGLEAGDLITAIDGRAMTSPNTLMSYLLTKKPGNTIAVTYVDQFGETHSASVKLASGPAQ
jgi:S1-C subfamily serine protease